MTIIIIGINFNIRERDLINRRLIGSTFRELFKNLLYEQSIIMIPSFILGFALSFVLNKILINSLINKAILNSTFSINYSIVNVLGVILISLIVLFLIMYFSTKKYKEIDNKNVAKNIKKQIIKFVFGLLFIISFFLLIIFNNTEVLYLFGGIFLIIGLYFVLEMTIVFISKIFFKCFSSFFFASSSIKNIEFNASLITKIILLLVNSMIFLNFSTNVINKMGVANYDINQNTQYLNGLMFLGSYLNIVFISFTLVVLVNGFLMYLKSLEKESNLLRNLGFTRNKIFFRTLFQFTLIWIAYISLSFVGTILISIIWKDQSALSNIKYWILEIFVVFFIMLILCFINWFYKTIKNK
ncbi:FtsX-like permease family protein [Mesoplasma florum]|uniref:FtsX-like permease family protein n=1 Tax=Mesoplasma florum TaxID=2151 RepID=UPI001E3EC649|nr:FtsX-like permease family protein [Mesoplasma florum]